MVYEVKCNEKIMKIIGSWDETLIWSCLQGIMGHLYVTNKEKPDSVMVSGASSYSGYIGGIEIEIDTHRDHRRKGYATICGAKLIIECLKRNLYPSWDAQNLWSVALAEKLGYHYDRTYTVYEIDW